MTVETLRELLRSRTRRSHQAIDRHPLLAPLSEPAPDRAAYAGALAALHGPQAALERFILPKVPMKQFPPRLPALAADLAALGREPWPLRARLPAVAGDAGIIGLLYVVEGANLGGAVLARHLRRHLPVDTPMRYFEEAGGHPRWERFWTFASQFCGTGNGARTSDAEDAADAAEATFAFYMAHLDSCLAAHPTPEADVRRHPCG